jgi:hypothetical protein
VADWLRRDLSEMVLDALSDERLPGVDYGFLRTVYEEMRGGSARHEALVWAWLLLERWHRMWIGGDARPPHPMIEGSTSALSELDAAAAVAGGAGP